MKRLLTLLFIVIASARLYAQDVPKKESVVLEWPAQEHWKVGDDQEDRRQHIIDMVHEGETVDKWTELANMTTIKGIRGLAIDTAMMIMYSSARASASDARLTFIKRGEVQECQWIIFSIESPHFDADPNPESQLWLVVQGKQALYTNFVAVKAASLSESFRNKWTAFFEKVRMAYN